MHFLSAHAVFPKVASIKKPSTLTVSFPCRVFLLAFQFLPGTGAADNLIGVMILLLTSVYFVVNAWNEDSGVGILHC